MTNPKHDAIADLERIKNFLGSTIVLRGYGQDEYDACCRTLKYLESLRSGQHEGGDDVHACACKFVGDTCIDICAYHQDLEKQNLNLTSRLEDFGAELAKLHNEKLGYKATPPQGELPNKYNQTFDSPRFIFKSREDSELVEIQEVKIKDGKKLFRFVCEIDWTDEELFRTALLSHSPGIEEMLEDLPPHADFVYIFKRHEGEYAVGIGTLDNVNIDAAQYGSGPTPAAAIQAAMKGE
jgi:hypothetical protein